MKNVLKYRNSRFDPKQSQPKLILLDKKMISCVCCNLGEISYYILLELGQLVE